MTESQACEVFGIASTIGLTKAELSRLRRNLLVRCHPDKAGGSTEVAARVTQAYTVLCRVIQVPSVVVHAGSPFDFKVTSIHNS